MLRSISQHGIFRLRSEVGSFAKRVWPPQLQSLMARRQHRSGARWQNLRLELTLDRPTPYPSLCFHPAGPTAWAAEFAAWRIDMIWEKSSPFPWGMVLQPVTPQPVEPWTLARAKSFDALLSTSREKLSTRHGSYGCAVLAKSMTHGFAIAADAEDRTIYVRADGLYAVGDWQQQALVSPSEVEEILHKPYRGHNLLNTRQ